MSKITSRVILPVIILFTLLQTDFAAFANEPFLSIETITCTKNGDMYVFTVPYISTSIDEVGILALLGGDTPITFEEGSDNDYGMKDIAYIDQFAPIGENSFQFSVRQSKFSSSTNHIYINISGIVNGVTVDENAEIEIRFIDGENADIEITVPGSTMDGYVGNIYSLAPYDGVLPDGKIPKLFIDQAPVGETLFSVERNKYILVLPANTSDTPEIKAVDGSINADDTIVQYGDVNGGSTVNATDKTLINLFITRPEISTLMNVIKDLISADVNGDGQINAIDKTLLNLFITRENALPIISN